MTDNEIIKVLECCEGDDGISYCNKCSLYEYDNCVHYISQKAREVINRQKAEIERLEIALSNEEAQSRVMGRLYKQAKSEAIKEFAERLKAISHPYGNTQMVFELQIDNLVNEMCGE